MSRKILGRDAEGRVIDIEIEGTSEPIPVLDADGGAVHDHDEAYEALGAVATHAATPHGGDGGEHPDLAAHETLGLVTDTDLSTHAATAHGTQAHAISGVSHTGTLDHSALGSVTANQHHNESHSARHATGGPDALAASDIGAAATGHNHDASYAGAAHDHDADYEASGAVATHAGAADPHGGYLLESAHGAHLALGTTAGTAAEGDHSHGAQGGVTLAEVIDALYPVGRLWFSEDPTNPGTVLGRGTWAAYGAGRVLIGVGGGFDTPGATGGSSTHTHAAHTDVINHTHAVTVTDPGHDHVENSNSATTGPNRGWGAADTSTNTSTATGYSTATATTGITASTANPAGGVAELTHDSPSHLPPYIVVHMWKRTA